MIKDNVYKKILFLLKYVYYILNKINKLIYKKYFILDLIFKILL